MRRLVITLMGMMLMVAAGAASARNLNRHDLEMCRWGADMARQAQQSKMSGVTLYSARRKLEHRHFNQPWMRKMALGITDQTYHSRSRLRPMAVKQTYYEGCIRHEKARR